MFKKIKYKYLLYFLVFFSISSCSDIIHDNQNTQETKLIKLSTNMGDITLELFQNKAPETVANFLKYTNEGKLNGTIFHRVIPNFMIHGGGHLQDMSQIDTFDPVINESSNNISNKKGTIAMARTSSPNSATSQFFINLRDNEFLDKANSADGYGYCVFGQVTDGIEIVEQIGAVSTGNNAGHSDVPIENIIINEVTLIE
jgi:peptidyl-prolyl cis-trans isomerase B (cyclophilin B)